jgi:uncharacterized protein
MQFQKAKKFILDKLKKELTKNLTYHSLGHIKDVYSSAENLATFEGIKGEDLTLLLTAVLFHDSGFVVSQKDHESLSCDIARQYLPDFEYSPAQIEVICNMILATQIPQSPKTPLEQVICDADLDYLGRDDFFSIGDNLFKELCMYGIISNEVEWNKLQVRFLEKHHYFTATAKRIRQAKKAENLLLVKSKLKKQ